MIDVENLVFTSVETALKTSYPNINVVSDYPNKPSSFPCVAIIEEDNSVYQDSQSSSCFENHASLMYSVNVFSNKENGRKTEAKKIMNKVDEAFANIKFTRTMKQVIPNVDNSIFRIVARYEAVVGKGQANGSVTTFQVYKE